MTRRQMLRRTGMGMGALSLGMLLRDALASAPSGTAAPPGSAVIRSPLAPRQPHFPAKAKHVIHIFAGGGPSHVDTFDPKPALARYENQSLPGLTGLAFPTPFKFEKYGRSGLEISELFRNLGSCADDLCVIRSMWTDVPAHEPASRFMHTGSLQIPKPSLGSWVCYGLGTDNQNMPGFISMGGKSEYRQASFLPSLYQGSNVNYSPKTPLTEVLLNIHNYFTPPDNQRQTFGAAGSPHCVGVDADAIGDQTATCVAPPTGPAPTSPAMLSPSRPSSSPAARGVGMPYRTRGRSLCGMPPRHSGLRVAASAGACDCCPERCHMTGASSAQHAVLRAAASPPPTG